MKLPHKTNHFWTQAIKILVVSLSFLVIFYAILEVSNAQWQLIFDLSKLQYVLFLGGFLSLLNWLLEGLKWNTLINDFTETNFSNALSETLRAHAVSIITPNKIGEYGAKASFYPKPLRSKILKQTFTGQFYQLLATLFFGILSLFVIYRHLSVDLKMSIAMAIILIGILIFSLTSKNKWVAKLKDHLESLFKLSDGNNLKVLLLSILRYVCFSHQFYGFLWLFQPELSYVEIMPFIFFIYFISSFVPTFLILDATLKAGLGLVLLSGFLSPEYILVTSLMMWVFNFGIPAIIGNVLLLKSKPLPLQMQQS